MIDNQAKLTSANRIWKAVIAALIVALVVLVAIVWPVEYGIDLKSVVQATGQEATATPEPSVSNELEDIMNDGVIAAPPGSHKSYTESFKTEVVKIPLSVSAEVEFKAHMKEGDTLLYSWKSAQLMYVDLHGEPYTYPEDDAVRYEEMDDVTAGHGRLTATFPGLHGWFWMNTSETDDVIELKVSGYYDKLEEVYRRSP